MGGEVVGSASIGRGKPRCLDRLDPAFRAPPPLNMRSQKPPGGDLDINDPVTNDLNPYDSVVGPNPLTRLILRATRKGNSAWCLVR
jgi:hypothetical protein